MAFGDQELKRFAAGVLFIVGLLLLAALLSNLSRQANDQNTREETVQQRNESDLNFIRTRAEEEEEFQPRDAQITEQAQEEL